MMNFPQGCAMTINPAKGGRFSFPTSFWGVQSQPPLHGFSITWYIPWLGFFPTIMWHKRCWQSVTLASSKMLCKTTSSTDEQLTRHKTKNEDRGRNISRYIQDQTQRANLYLSQELLYSERTGGRKYHAIVVGSCTIKHCYLSIHNWGPLLPSN